MISRFESEALHLLFGVKMQIINPIPNDVYLACSGGIDSMFVYHFLKAGRKNVVCLFFNHGTTASAEAEEFLKLNVENLIIGNLSKSRLPGESPEKFFRDQRYSFFSEFNNKPIIMCHHLNDVAESWIMSSLRGTPFLIPYKRDNFLRPFLMVTKQEIFDYCGRKNIQWCEDKSNSDTSIPRNRVRHNIIEECREVYPGFFGMLKNKIQTLIGENEMTDKKGAVF